MHLIDAIRAQGNGLRASRAAVTSQLETLDLVPWRGRRLALTGMGASSNAIAAALPGYWAAGLSATAWGGADLALAGSAAGAEAVVAVSQTGRSAEVHAALRALPETCPRLAVTDVADSPIGALADAVLPLALLADSKVRTIGYTGTVQALLLLGDALAGTPSPDWDQIADEAERLTAEAETLAGTLSPGLRAANAFDVVGSGVHAGTAAQGALLLREVAKLPAASYETHQYLHGPVEAAGAGRALIVIGGAREVTLAGSLAEAGADVLLVTSEDATPKRTPVFRLPGPGAAPEAGVLAVLPLQTIAGRLAADRGLPDGVFRYHQDDTKLDETRRK